ncbi:MoxR family ATPase [Priestia endophytica]|uniref:AAA family ATPase n=1 Tax=Priestia endophytica TaxID=135735 RepID=UPI003D2D9857
MIQAQFVQRKAEEIINSIETILVGKRDVVMLSLVALLSKGHVLLEDVPGVGKTKMMKALAASIGADFKRIQFTPDLLPSDVLGASIYNQRENEFEYRQGPIMAQFVLADEINRTSPKTQSALLEAMEEGFITVDGVTRPLPEPFFVMATQNPVDFEGTYRLPEAQLDRFLLKIKMGYPTPEQEMNILKTSLTSRASVDLPSIITMDELKELQKEVQFVHASDLVKRYIVSIVNKTRNHPLIQLGVSPRGSIALLKAAQAFALLQGRDYVIPDDVQLLVSSILSHRITVNAQGSFERKDAADVLQELLHETSVPVIG